MIASSVVPTLDCSRNSNSNEQHALSLDAWENSIHLFLHSNVHVPLGMYLDFSSRARQAYDAPCPA